MWENRLEALQPGGGALAHLLKGLCFLLLAKGEQLVWANLIDNKASFYCLTRVSFIFFRLSNNFLFLRCTHPLFLLLSTGSLSSGRLWVSTSIYFMPRGVFSRV